MTYMVKNYGFIDFITNLAGVFELSLLVIGFLIFPIARYDFNLWVAKKLYFGSTEDKRLFSSTKTEEERKRHDYIFKPDITPDDDY